MIVVIVWNAIKIMMSFDRWMMAYCNTKPYCSSVKETVDRANEQMGKPYTVIGSLITRADEVLGIINRRSKGGKKKKLEDLAALLPTLYEDICPKDRVFIMDTIKKRMSKKLDNSSFYENLTKGLIKIGCDDCAIRAKFTDVDF